MPKMFTTYYPEKLALSFLWHSGFVSSFTLQVTYESKIEIMVLPGGAPLAF